MVLFRVSCKVSDNDLGTVSYTYYKEEPVCSSLYRLLYGCIGFGVAYGSASRFQSISTYSVMTFM